MLDAVRSNWDGYEEMQREATKCHGRGDGNEDSCALANWFNQDLFALCQTKTETYGTSSLDITLPFGKAGKEQIAMLLRVLSKLRLKHLQLNCVSADKLLDAQKHPELYRDLIVRVTGFSAQFVSLSPGFQEEIIKRHVYGV